MQSCTIVTEDLSKAPESEIHLSRISVSYYFIISWSESNKGLESKL